jgi:hypothetical protein
MIVPYTVFPDDIYLVSYPKSGNTWMKFHLAVLFYNRKCGWNAINSVIPDAYYTSNEELLKYPRPRIIKSHQGYDARYPKVIYIARDVRDVIISYFYYHKRLGYFPNLDFDAFFDLFLSSGVWPCGWDAHVNSWLTNRDKVPGGFLLLRYEDLLRDIKGESRRILNFLQIERSEKEIKEACKWSSFEHVKEMERSETQQPSTIPFVRNGKEGQWVTMLNVVQKQRVNQKYGDLLVNLGYTV